MLLHRSCFALLIAGCCCATLRAAYEVPPSSTPDSGTSNPPPGSSSPGTSAPGTSSSGGGASSSFGSNVFSAGTGAYGSGSPAPSSGGGGATGAGAASAFTKQPEGVTYSLPGFYGQGRQTFTSGVGILAKPRYQTTFSLSMGYDDNYNSAPGGGAPTLAPNGTFDTIAGVAPGTPIFEERLVFISGQLQLKKILVGFSPGVPGQIIPHFDTIPPIGRDGSPLTRASFGFNMQMATSRSLLTLSANGGTDYYWDKPKDPFENNAGVNANFLYKLTPRLEVTAALGGNYATQPDYSQVSSPTRPTNGPYYDVNSRADLAYRISPRLSTTASLSYSALRYTNKVEEVGNHDEFTAGIQANYLWNPRYTFLLEYRHSTVAYANSSTRDSTTDFLLTGVEFRYSSRLEGSLRIGESSRSFDVGGSSSAPYLESALNYRATSRSSLAWTNRFGFEEPNGPDEERLVLRSGITYGYSFTPRMRGSLIVNFVRTRDSVIGNSSAGNVELTFDSTAALNYSVNQHFNLSLTYSFTDVASNQPLQSFYRNRVFLGGDYTF